MMRTSLLAPLLLLLAACTARDAAPKVTHAWVRLPAVEGQPAAAYFTLAAGGRARRLVRIESALTQRIELHESMTDARGMATMTPLAGVDIPAGASEEFKPGARHAMLIGVEPAVTPGTAVPLRFGFADGTTAEAEAKTVAAGEDAPY